jgi:hypothetical protein
MRPINVILDASSSPRVIVLNSLKIDVRFVFWMFYEDTLVCVNDWEQMLACFDSPMPDL